MPKRTNILDLHPRAEQLLRGAGLDATVERAKKSLRNCAHLAGSHAENDFPDHVSPKLTRLALTKRMRTVDISKRNTTEEDKN